jgi:hypothetical protein
VGREHIGVLRRRDGDVFVRKRDARCSGDCAKGRKGHNKFFHNKSINSNMDKRQYQFDTSGRLSAEDSLLLQDSRETMAWKVSDWRGKHTVRCNRET